MKVATRRRSSVHEEATSIRVAVRVRPFSKRELASGARRVVEMMGDTAIITDPTAYMHLGESLSNVSEEELEIWKTTFNFDRCFWSFDDRNPTNPIATQQDVFETYGPWIIENAVKGYNCSLFAYGQTGSGKTHTMTGGDSNLDSNVNVGFIPRLCNGVFTEIQKALRMNEEYSSFHVEASYFEIYNERVFDLLNPKSKMEAPASLRVREHPKTGAYVEDLLTIAVSSYKEISELLRQGAQARRVAETQMNKESSRSHAVFQLILRSEKQHPDGRRVEQMSRLYLVDLAGSERVSASGATGARLKEAANINKSLSALSDVIKALTTRSSEAESMKPGNRFIPYRNSSLTWLLKESLGGNAKTVMLATLSPDAANYQETLSTLKYAERAKKIVNKARVNKESNAALVETLQHEIFELRKQLAIYEENGGKLSETKKEESRKLLHRLQSQEKLVHSLSATWEEKREMAHDHFASLEETNKRLKEERDEMQKEMLRLKNEKKLLESREAEEERRKQERQIRHKAQLDNQLRKRKMDQTKQQDLQRQLEIAEKRIIQLEEEVSFANEGKTEAEMEVMEQRKRWEEERTKNQKILVREEKQLFQIQKIYQLAVEAQGQEDILLGDGSLEAQLERKEENSNQSKNQADSKACAGKEPQEMSTMLKSIERFVESELVGLKLENETAKVDLNRQLKNVKSKYERVTKQLADSLTKSETMEKAISALHEEIEKSQDRLAPLNTFEELLAVTHVEFADFVQRVERVALQKKEATKILDYFVDCESILKLEENNKQTLFQLEDYRSSHEKSQAEVEELEEARKESEAKIAALKQQVLDSEHEIEGYKSSVSGLKEFESECSMLSTRIEELSKEKGQLLASVEKLQEEKEEMKLGKEMAEKELYRCRENADHLADVVEATTSQLEAFRNDLVTKQENAGVLSAEIENLKEYSQKLQKLHSSEIENLKQVNESLEDEIKRRMETEKLLKEHNDETAALLEDMKTELKRIETQRNEACEREEECKEQLMSAQAESGKLRGYVNQLKDDLSDRDRKVESLAKQLEEFKKSANDRCDLQMSLASSRTQLTSSTRQIRVLEETVDLASSQYEKETLRLRTMITQVEEEKAKAFEELRSKVTECEKWKYSEMEAVKDKSRLELEIMALKDKLEFSKEKERSYELKLSSIGAVQAEKLKSITSELVQVKEKSKAEIKYLNEKLEEARSEIQLLSQKVANERTAFDQIFKAQAEVLSYSQFPRDVRRMRRASVGGGTLSSSKSGGDHSPGSPHSPPLDTSGPRPKTAPRRSSTCKKF